MRMMAVQVKVGYALCVCGKWLWVLAVAWTGICDGLARKAQRGDIGISVRVLYAHESAIGLIEQKPLGSVYYKPPRFFRCLVVHVLIYYTVGLVRFFSSWETWEQNCQMSPLLCNAGVDMPLIHSLLQYSFCFFRTLNMLHSGSFVIVYAVFVHYIL